MNLSLSFSVYAEQRVAKHLPLIPAASNSQDIQSGLSHLAQLNFSQKDRSGSTQLYNTAIAQAEEFQNFLNEKMQTAFTKNNGAFSYDSTEKQISIPVVGLIREITVRYKSLIQREGNDPSNTAVARIYIPYNYKKCDYKYPTTIFLHHILNEVPKIEQAAQFMSAGTLNAPLIMAVLHMPYYGDRTSSTKQFLSSDLNEFKLNMAQLILDTHMLKSILHSLSEVNTQSINLSGISLGAVLGITVGAFDQSFNSYTFANGGADIADILINRVKNRPDSEVAVALKDLKDDEATLRFKLSATDGFTWMHRYQNKNITLINATRDDIVDFDRSVKKLAGFLKMNNNLQHIINDDTHSPSGNILQKYNRVFKPITTSIIGNKPTYRCQCESINF